MTLTIELDPEKEKVLRQEATRRGVSVETYARGLVEQHLPANGAVSGEEDSDREALSRAVLGMTRRTRGEIAQAQQGAEALIQPGRPLPPGKTVLDVVAGQWPGQETDAQVTQALKRLS
jgi:hypothetical protein